MKLSKEQQKQWDRLTIIEKLGKCSFCELDKKGSMRCMCD